MPRTALIVFLALCATHSECLRLAFPDDHQIGQMGPQLPNWRSVFEDLQFKLKEHNVAAKEDHNRFALAFTGCGVDYCQQAMSSMKTAVAQIILDSARGDQKSYDIYLVADKACREVFTLPVENVPAVNSLTIIPLSDILAIDGSEVEAFKYCSPVRLYLPRILQKAVDRFVYIDSDAMVASSLIPIVNIMEQNTEEALFLAEEVDTDLCYPCGVYASHKEQFKELIKEGSNGFNAGILGVNVNRWMAKGIDSSVSAVLQQVREGLFEIPFGDQDVINRIGKTNPSLIFQMPGEFNLRTDSNVPNRKPWILHGNRKRFDEGRVWHDLGAKLLDAAERVLTDGLQPTDPADLWEKAGLVNADTVCPQGSCTACLTCR